MQDKVTKRFELVDSPHAQILKHWECCSNKRTSNIDIPLDEASYSRAKWNPRAIRFRPPQLTSRSSLANAAPSVTLRAARARWPIRPYSIWGQALPRREKRHVIAEYENKIKAARYSLDWVVANLKLF